MPSRAERAGVTALVAAAAVASLAAHAGLFLGLANERGLSQAHFTEKRILIQSWEPTPPECACKLPATPLFLPTPGWADVQCRVGSDGQVDQCRWLRESAPGAGDAAMMAIKRFGYRPEESRRRARSMTFRMHVQISPYA